MHPTGKVAAAAQLEGVQRTSFAGLLSTVGKQHPSLLFIAIQGRTEKHSPGMALKERGKGHLHGVFSSLQNIEL